MFAKFVREYAFEKYTVELSQDEKTVSVSESETQISGSMEKSVNILFSCKFDNTMKGDDYLEPDRCEAIVLCEAIKIFLSRVARLTQIN